MKKLLYMLFLTGFLTASQMSYATSSEVIVETEDSAVLIQDDVAEIGRAHV